MKQTRIRLPRFFLKYSKRLKALTEQQLVHMLDGKAGQGKTRTEQKGDEVKMEYDGPACITTQEEAVNFFNIDLDNYDVEKAVFNSYPIGAQQRYQVKVFTKRRKSDLAEFKRKLLEEIPAAPNVIIPKTKGYAVEVNISDLHLGKVGFDPDGLELNWDIATARDVALSAIEHFLSEVGGVDHFIVPIGNDLFNVDNLQNTTTKGTPQMTSQFWQTLFLYGCKLQRQIIERLEKVAPVHAYLVPGNHDNQTVFSLGEVLRANFEGHKGVEIDNTPILRKYHHWQGVLIGFIHGHRGNNKDLRHTMTVDRPVEFSQSTYKAFHKGHLHGNSKSTVLDLKAKDEVAGVDIEVCPSLCPTDEWHYSNLYIGNLRRAKAFVYEPGGLAGEVYFRAK